MSQNQWVPVVTNWGIVLAETTPWAALKEQVLSPPRYLNQFSLLSVTQVSWKYLWEYGVQSSDILLSDDFLSSHHIAAQLTVNWYYCEKLENWSLLRVQILSLIQSFKPTKWSSLNSLLNHQSFFLFSFPTEIWPKVNRKEEYKNGREKEGRENGNVNHHTTEQPSKKRKEDFSESKSEVKKPSPEKKKVCKPFDYHTLLLQN